VGVEALDGVDWSASSPDCITKGEKHALISGEEARRAPEPVWTLLNAGNFLPNQKHSYRAVCSYHIINFVEAIPS
jgi:hypothetical protein